MRLRFGDGGLLLRLGAGDLFLFEELLSLDFDFDFDLGREVLEPPRSFSAESFSVVGTDSALESFVCLSADVSSCAAFSSGGIGISALIILGSIAIGFTTPI